ncbi:helix-turn-helix domain-containing protein [Vallitalea okinawensis]|uniref:helix-turn-helix domain-containing protein n=1 Tax=Vallitalea okinawensis TaxID=2078660 RepID=UPI000CFC310C|nr:helix-turn-helix domain-containing protein [Vallitalea okinawensis]
MEKIQEKDEQFFRMTIQKDKDCLVHPHWHEHIEFIKVLNGKVAINIDQNHFLATEGDIIYISSRRMHSVYSVSDSKASIMGMVFDRSYLSNVIERYDTSHIYSIFATTKKMENHIQSSHVLWQVLNECIEGAFTEFTHQDIMFEMSIKAYVYRIVSSLIRYYKNDIIGHEQFTKLAHDFMALKPVLDYIDCHFNEKIYTKDLCQLVTMSPSHFTRYFKKVTEETPMAYINRIRINAAIKLLRDTQKSIAVVAELTGFCNINYFDKMFKTKVGSTPLEYRNKSRDNR